VLKGRGPQKVARNARVTRKPVRKPTKDSTFVGANAPRGSTAASNLVVTQREFWGTVTTGAAPVVYQFQPGSSGLSRLDAIGTLYEQWRLRSCVVRYATGSGATKDGLVHIGFVPDLLSLPTQLAGVVLLNPVVNTAVWEPNTLRIPTGEVNKGRWLYTDAGGHHLDLIGFGVAVAYTGAAVNVGQIWVEYSVEFRGPSIPRQVTLGAAVFNYFSSDAITAPGSSSSSPTWTNGVLTGFINGGLNESPVTASYGGCVVGSLATGSNPYARFNVAPPYAQPGYAPKVGYIYQVAIIHTLRDAYFQTAAGGWWTNPTWQSYNLTHTVTNNDSLNTLTLQPFLTRYPYGLTYSLIGQYYCNVNVENGFVVSLLGNIPAAPQSGAQAYPTSTTQFIWTPLGAIPGATKLAGPPLYQPEVDPVERALDGLAARLQPNAVDYRAFARDLMLGLRDAERPRFERQNAVCEPVSAGVYDALFSSVSPPDASDEENGSDV
jgi:hypothetical protein